MTPLLLQLLSRLGGLRKWVWLRAYQLLSGRLAQDDWVFMNYGWLGKDAVAQSTDQLCAQLYAQALRGATVEGAAVLEVGCGRGGGSAWLARTARPASVTGVDLSSKAIDFCQRFHGDERLSFVTADAEALPFAEGSFDVVINIESSHCYGDVEQFLAEVSRVLRPGGWFCWADMWALSRVEPMLARLDGCGLERMHEADLTAGVLRALEHADPAKQQLLNRTVPWLLRPFFRPLMALQGSSMHQRLVSGEIRYFCRVYQKPSAA